MLARPRLWLIFIVLTLTKVCTTVCVHAKSQWLSDLWLTLFPISIIRCDRMGLAKSDKTTDVLHECDTQVAKNSQWQCDVFGADLARVLAGKGEQQGTT